MTLEAQEKIEEFQEELNKLWQEDKIDYSDDRIYALGMILHSITDEISLEDALNEFFNNTNNTEIEAEVKVVETKVKTK